MNESRVMEIAGVTIEIHDDLDETIRAALVSGKYESMELRALSGVLQSDDVVMELGTGIGLLSAYCAKQLGGHRVFTFEANPKLENRIRETYRLNQVNPQLEMCMLAEHDGERDFFIHQAFWYSSANNPTGAVEVARVKTRSLNDRIQQIRPTILVMDIEGGELELMRFINLSPFRCVVMEIHERVLGRGDADGIVRRFYAEGFRIHRVLSQWEIGCFERAPVADPARHLSLEEFLETRWRLAGHWAFDCFDELCSLMPRGCRYALVDEDQWGSLPILPGRFRFPFTERQGQYWGAPAHDADAIDELKRQRGNGLEYLVFGPASFWWLDYYAEFARCLHKTARLLCKTDRLVAFDLRPSEPQVAQG